MSTRKTSAVRRGLRVLLALVESDVEAGNADESPRWKKQERKEIERALMWLREQCQ